MDLVSNNIKLFSNYFTVEVKTLLLFCNTVP